MEGRPLDAAIGSAQNVLRFPEGFRWGCATAAHQVEGGNTNNDWYAWEQAEGHIHGGQKSDRACDWWRDAEADLRLAAQMGQNAHRLSVEWSRIEPREGLWDDAAIDRYRAILRFMRDNGIEPMVTLHHFTTPLWLVERGGWENPATISLFERFAGKVARALGEYCDLWITLNEPLNYALLGWLSGAPRDRMHAQNSFPPGKHDLFLMLKVVENLFRGHGAAYHALHREQPHAQVGVGNNMPFVAPLNDKSLLDRLAAVQPARLLTWSGIEASVRGRIPRLIGWRHVKELENTSDFIGVQYYQRVTIAFDAASIGTLFSRQVVSPGAELSDLNFSEVYPQGLYHLLRRTARYGKPIYITENGIPDADDDRRPAFLIAHLWQIWKALRDGVPVKGYFHWTLTDNFEWAEGWNLRFGLIKLDPHTQAREMRRSAALYGEMCKSNALSADTVQLYAPELTSEVFAPSQGVA
jgi:beta-glucosidase